MLTWTPDYETGFERVDMQHRQIIGMLNDLEELLGGPLPPREYTDHLVCRIQAYFAAHFGFEENCMERVRCPAYERNRAAHAELLRMLDSFDASYRSTGPTRELLEGFRAWSFDWAAKHILTVDIALRGCARG